MTAEQVKTANDVEMYVEGCINDYEGGVSTKEETIVSLCELVAHVYGEAMRWRDPKEEPPINQDIVLVKTDNDCYATAYFHGKASGFICYGEDAYIEFGDIIGWKPIE